MFHSIILLLVNLIIIRQISSENLGGIYVIDACECNSPTENCDLNGPFIFDQQRSTLAIRYGTVQVGVGALENNHLDLYLNHNRCKGLWNGKSRVADLTCQRKGGVICSTKFRCASGACREAKALTATSSAVKTTISALSIINSLFILLY
ncbi:unnamed protein product [Rotaria magnacalcarata]|uniref:Uncharacterized protein n=3 Tax=Rotaria magnacalcarata TaxID=392030 RepID=A0A816USK1_9BILA|nr:unnamed protein product [Rotaria magnacalcarata]CAF1361165.1 unnamed protein product [Rotaria magnacalcarata]CAF1992435.1 unnamed protein product [Rotaria magnacalcarata]CAF2071715.1 unnamed protein product [Rotaria magnacalcarata]CAF2111938.1 unnamed protein product [Rotaria magnacalcarata]